MADENSQRIERFFEYFWGDEPGKVYIAAIPEGVGKNIKQVFANWPEQKKALVTSVLAANSGGNDVYFSPAVYTREAEKPLRENVASVNARWVDLDGNGPKDWEATAKEKNIPLPSLVIQSSEEGNQHAYWRTARTNDVSGAEDANRNLAATLGADHSGWDANQLLRIPGTTNYGFKSSGKRQARDVTVSFANDGEHESAVFSALNSAERTILERIAISSIPPVLEVQTLGKWTEELYDQFRMNKQEASDSSPNKRSGALQRLAYLGAESGLSDEYLYSILLDADTRWEKYSQRSKAGRDKILRDTIAKARTKVGYLSSEDTTLAGIMSGFDTNSEPENSKVIFNYQEMLDQEYNFDWVMEDLLSVGGLGLIVGQPGVGKTTMGMHISQQIAIGRERVGIWNNPGGPRKVLMLSLEMPGPSLQHFMKNMAPGYTKDTMALSRNFNILPTGDSLHLDTKAGQQFLENLLAEYRPDLLFIDSFSKIISKPMSDELAAKAMMDYLAKIRAQYSMSIFIVHHERKRSSDKAAHDPGSLSDVYGNQYIAAGLDFVLAMRKVGQNTVLRTHKNRLAPDLDDVHFKRGPNMTFIEEERAENVGYEESVRDERRATDPPNPSHGILDF